MFLCFLLLCEQRKKGISFRYFLWAIKENDKYVLLALLQSVEFTKQEMNKDFVSVFLKEKTGLKPVYLLKSESSRPSFLSSAQLIFHSLENSSRKLSLKS